MRARAIHRIRLDAVAMLVPVRVIVVLRHQARTDADGKHDGLSNLLLLLLLLLFLLLLHRNVVILLQTRELLTEIVVVQAIRVAHGRSCTGELGEIV